MHCYKMEETVNENSERGSESKCKPPAGIKNVRGFKCGHAYLKSPNAATSETREKTAVYGCICGNSKILRPRLD